MFVTFMGLGAMGYPMAGHLSQKYDVCVYNRSLNKAQNWIKEYQGRMAEDIATAVQDADIIVMCLGRDEDVLSVVETSEFLDNLKAGAILIDHTTTSFALAQRLHKICQEKQAFFIDAPVSGGQDGAIKGAVSAMMGGEAGIIAKVKPLLDCYCQRQTHIGDIGYGQLAKMVNQICIAGILQGLSEGIKFGESENIDMGKLLNAISGGAAQSWQMVNRGQSMHQRKFDFGFALDWMIKDLGYCLKQAEQNGTALPLTQNVYEQYQELSKQGYGSKDTSALILSKD